MIAPLCGNGMAMAIHSAGLLSSIILKNYSFQNPSIEKTGQEYAQRWEKEFGTRLLIGRNIQRLFGNEKLTDVFVATSKLIPGMASGLIGLTHGKEFMY